MQTYQLLDSGNQQRLEQWGPFRLIRPDPVAIWPQLLLPEWNDIDAIYHGTTVQNGSWEQVRPLPASWVISVGEWHFTVGLGASKHLGLFPEQLEQWQSLATLIKKQTPTFTEPIRFLNLFAYTGAASIAATTAGAFTTHVDSSSPAIGRAKENQKLNGLNERSIRWIKEDVLTFVQREIRRGKTYDLIALDPPIYGHGANGEQFSLAKEFPLLLKEVHKLLSDKAIAIFITTYSTTFDAASLSEICTMTFPGASVSTQPLQLSTNTSQPILTTGNWTILRYY